MSSKWIKIGCMIIPYLIGISISSTVMDKVETLIAGSHTDQVPPNIAIHDLPHHMSGISLVIHRNGESEPCGSAKIGWSEAFFNVAEKRQLLNDLNDLDMYELDSLLTETLATENDYFRLEQCGPEKPPDSIQGNRREVWGRGLNYQIDGITNPFLTFCDMGEDHTPILPDHDALFPIESQTKDFGIVGTLPCHFHTREGRRITNLNDLIDVMNTAKNINKMRFQQSSQEECLISSEDGTATCSSIDDAIMKDDVQLHLYAVPAGRIFMFAPSYVGEEFRLDYLDGVLERPISLKVMSITPRVFDVYNFFSKEESDAIVTKALNEKSESHRIKRSSTGATGYNVNTQRTSENGFDTHGKTAMIVKKRCFQMLGFETYDESFADGLQVLRYNKTTAYISHMDWIDDPGDTTEHDFESSYVGTNRFATVLLYMSDLGPEDGGETVFTKAWPADVPENERVSSSDALTQLRTSGEVSFLKPNSWEERMVADCRTRLAVRPHSARAVLFYSQHPNGEEDESSLHGACPVLGDNVQKWAANLWVWNGPRNGYTGAPINPNFKGSKEAPPVPDGQLKASFINTGKNPAFKDVDIFFQETFWAPLGFGAAPVHVNTYDGHEWNIKNKKGETLKQFIINQDKVQNFEL